MKIYKKKVKRHEEVWAETDEYGEVRVQVCRGNSNYGRLYIMCTDEYGQFLDDEETKTAFKLFKEIWAENVDNHPFSE